MVSTTSCCVALMSSAVSSLRLFPFAAQCCVVARSCPQRLLFFLVFVLRSVLWRLLLLFTGLLVFKTPAGIRLTEKITGAMTHLLPLQKLSVNVFTCGLKPTKGVSLCVYKKKSRSLYAYNYGERESSLTLIIE
jgi:hypothetical protein